MYWWKPSGQLQKQFNQKAFLVEKCIMGNILAETYYHFQSDIDKKQVFRDSKSGLYTWNSRNDNLDLALLNHQVKVAKKLLERYTKQKFSRWEYDCIKYERGATVLSGNDNCDWTAIITISSEDNLPWPFFTEEKSPKLHSACKWELANGDILFYSKDVENWQSQLDNDYCFQMKIMFRK